MIVSPDPVPNGSGRHVVVRGILTIQKEILLIEKHKREHLSSSSGLGQPDSSCIYCQRPPFRERSSGKKTLFEKKGSLNLRRQLEIERVVNISGKNGVVIVPRTWTGKRVRITLVDIEF